MIQSFNHPFIQSSSCWGITSGNAGMVAQVRALANMLGITAEMKVAQLHPLLAWLPNVVLAPFAPLWLGKGGDALTPPYPDMVISCGRRAAMVALGLKKRAPRTTKFIHIQDPHLAPTNFDAVVAMEHDALFGSNVISTRYALHQITASTLHDAAQQWQGRFAAYPKPYVSVLLGGSTNKYHLSAKAMQHAITALQQLLQRADVSLLITPSRRTGAQNIAMLQSAFAGNPRVYVYDLLGDNPYLGMLALADWLVVSNDSVNMMSEARATGKPLYILPFTGHQNTKPARFSRMLVEEGSARLLDGRLERWSYASADDRVDLVQQLKVLL